MVAAAATRWRRQRDVVRSVGARVPAIAELEVISQKLADLADVVDAALQDAVTHAHRAALARAKDPVGELLIAVVPALDDWLGV
jgi:hypothetical protein